MRSKRSTLGIFVFISLLLGSSISCFAADEASDGVKNLPTIKVTWNILSGLPSPEWFVTDPKAIEELLRLLSNLPTVTLPDGWREFGGFTLWAYMNPEPIDFPKYVAVKDGIVKIMSWDDPVARFFQDKNGLEDFLLAEARSRKFDSISGEVQKGQ